MALLSYAIAGAEDIYSSVPSTKASWYNILLQHFDPQWLEALLASTVCSFSPLTPRAGVFLELEVFDSTQPLPEFFYRFHVPVWYPWSANMAKNSKYAHLAPLPYQLQEGASFLTKSPRPSTSTLPPTTPITPSVLPLAGSSSRPNPITWAEFILRRKERYEEWVKKETPQEQQVRLARLRNPPKVSAKMFEWTADDNGNLCREVVPKKMREDILGSYRACQIYYDPIENEYDCCKEYNSGAPGEPVDDYIDDCLSWDGDDVSINQVEDDRILPARMPSPEVEIDDSWNPPLAPNPRSSDNFIAEVHRILYLQTLRDAGLCNSLGLVGGGLPMAAFETAQISAAAAFVDRLHTKGTSISADEWDLSRENRQSIFFSTRLKAVRCVSQDLFMFNFKTYSTVQWKLTVKTPAHALLVCRLDSQLDESGLAYYLLENGIPFHTLQLSTTLSRSPISTHPPLIIPFRSANYVFTWKDYEAFRQQCHVIVKQARGRAALLRGYYPWRVAISEVSFSSVISGPSRWSTDPKEMLMVKLLETGEEFIDDKLTDIELNLLCGMYSTSTNIPGQQASLSWYPPTIKFEQSGRNPGRWTEVEETKFLVQHRRQMEEGSSNADGIERGPLPASKWKNGLRGSSDIHHALLRINKEARRHTSFLKGRIDYGLKGDKEHVGPSELVAHIITHCCHAGPFNSLHQPFFSLTAIHLPALPQYPSSTMISLKITTTDFCPPQPTFARHNRLLPATTDFCPPQPTFAHHNQLLPAMADFCPPQPTFTPVNDFCRPQLTFAYHPHFYILDPIHPTNREPLPTLFSMHGETAGVYH
ncbi:hypothetical protein BYT27DRAFT_7251316 [Phlegmacium glaucopus]|nr:hypothetical protein BYT27DRAFT_7251316 [Phlegmacium glaucopus]